MNLRRASLPLLFGLTLASVAHAEVTPSSVLVIGCVDSIGLHEWSEVSTGNPYRLSGEDDSCSCSQPPATLIDVRNPYRADESGGMCPAGSTMLLIDARNPYADVPAAPSPAVTIELRNPYRRH